MENYLESCQTKFWKDVFDQELQYLLRVLKCNKDVLSVGCGPAIIEKGLLDQGFHVTGLDVSQEAIEGAPDNLRTVIGSAENMVFRDASFDAVIYIASLQFIDNYREAISETARVLRSGGKLVAMLLNPESKFFKKNTQNVGSYMSKIKHRDIAILERTIEQYFSIQTEYYLGIKDKEIFPSQDHSLASLYIIRGVKRH